MRKKISLFLVFTLICLMCGCSRETKMGIGEFSDRIYKDYKLTFEESSMALEEKDGNNTIYCQLDSFLFVFYLGTNNNICGIAGMLPKEKEDELQAFLDDFEKCVSVFTLNGDDSVRQTFDDCKISAESIKFTDGNKLHTVGKFKYYIITNEYSVTLFCDRV